MTAEEVAKRETLRARVIVFTTAVVFRVALFFSGIIIPIYETGDSSEYRLLAQSILHRGVFGFDGVPKMNRTPGYPAFLALMFATGGDHQVFITGVQILMDALICVMVFDLAQRLATGRRNALIAGIAGATCIFMAALTLSVMTETLYSLTAVLSVWILPRGSVSRLTLPRNRWRMAVSGLAIGFGTLVRPPEAFSLAVVLGIAALVLAKRVGVKRVFQKNVIIAGAVMGLSFTAVVAPWMARNRVVFHEEWEKPVHDNVTLLGYKTDIPGYRHWYSKEYTFFRKSYEEPMVQEIPYQPPVIARFVYPGEKEEVDQAFAALEGEMHASDTIPITEPTLNAFQRIGDKRYAYAPRLYVTAVSSRFLKFWIAPRASILYAAHGGAIPLWRSIALTAYDVLYLALGVAGLILGYRRARAMMIGVWGTLIAHTLFYTLWHTSPHSRYAVPLFPFLCVGIAVAVQRLGARLAHYRASGSVRAVST